MQGFKPDIISSDNNASSWFLPPLYTLPRILTRFVELGLTLEEVIEAATLQPAQLLGLPELGSLAAGTPADISIFSWKDQVLDHTDFAGHFLHGHHALVPMMTFKDGKCVYCQANFM